MVVPGIAVDVADCEAVGEAVFAKSQESEKWMKLNAGELKGNWEATRLRTAHQRNA